MVDGEDEKSSCKAWLEKWKCFFLRQGLEGSTSTESVSDVAEMLTIGESTVKCA
jgi:hypothetical protein